MILIDSSAWIEFLRGTGSGTCDLVESLLDDSIAICDPIRMEILAGARDEVHLADLRALLARATTLPTGPTHYEEAAALHRRARASGLTVRRPIDCLIAAVAIDHDVELLHSDRDFDVIARTSPLRIRTTAPQRHR